jgi:D-threo-aldose 1-dehydrogenase
MGLVDRIGFGCVGLTAFPTPSAAHRVLEAAFDAGIRHFDTAPAYGLGYSERLLGEFLRGRQGQVQVATKFSLWRQPTAALPTWLVLPLNYARKRLRPPRRGGSPAVEASGEQPRLGKAALEAQFDASRRRLGVEAIDLYLFHEAVPDALEPAAFDYLQDLKAKGLVRLIGLAANGANYLPLRPEDLTGWDVLQYESGPAWPQHAGLLRRFPDQTHIFHSCLKDVVRTEAAVTAVLAERLAANPGGKVLFSSMRPDHIRANLRALG